MVEPFPWRDAMRTRSQVPFYISAAVGGAALAFYFDRQSGRRRRHQSRDQALSLARHGAKRARKLVHHATADASGMARPPRPPGRRRWGGPGGAGFWAPGRAENERRAVGGKGGVNGLPQHDVPKG